jgi:hypothetical protein
VVGEKDLAEQLRKRPDIIGTALTLLLSEQKVQKAPLSGYWKLNVDLCDTENVRLARHMLTLT